MPSTLFCYFFNQKLLLRSTYLLDMDLVFDIGKRINTNHVFACACMAWNRLSMCPFVFQCYHSYHLTFKMALTHLCFLAESSDKIHS